MRDSPVVEEGEDLYGFPMTLGERIRRWVARQGISQKELAHEAGLHPSDLSKIINGNRDPGFSTLKSIVDGLGISMVEFFSLGESAPSADRGVVSEDLEEWRGKVLGARKGKDITIEDLTDEELRKIIRIVRAVQGIEGTEKDETP